jgi:hypothetical protein
MNGFHGVDPNSPPVTSMIIGNAVKSRQRLIAEKLQQPRPSEIKISYFGSTTNS